jgi:hypothetical protein
MIGGAAQISHHDRLNDAALGDRSRQLIEIGIGKIMPRIARIGTNAIDRNPTLLPVSINRGRLHRHVANKRRQPSPQSRSCCFFSHLGISRALRPPSACGIPA